MQSNKLEKLSNRAFHNVEIENREGTQAVLSQFYTQYVEVGHGVLSYFARFLFVKNDFFTRYWKASV